MPAVRVVALVMTLIAGPALGQTLPANSFSPDASSLPQALPGAKGFTEVEAKLRFEGKGYSNIQGLHKDTFGIWHANARKDGRSVNVSLDIQGTVGIQAPP
jgi:hypothetical protein